MDISNKVFKTNMQLYSISFLKGCVFSFFLKEVTELQDRRLIGKLFQSSGAALANALSP